MRALRRIALLGAAAAALVPAGSALGQAKPKSISGTGFVATLHIDRATGLLISAGDVKLSGGLGEGVLVYKAPRLAPGPFAARSFAFYLDRGTFKGTASGVYAAQENTQNLKITDGKFKVKGTGAYRGRTMTGTWSADAPHGTFELVVKATVR